MIEARQTQPSQKSIYHSFPFHPYTPYFYEAVENPYRCAQSHESVGIGMRLPHSLVSNCEYILYILG